MFNAVSNQNGQISAYAVDYQSGVLTQISGSPFSTNLTNPSTVIAAPNGKTIYVVGGSQQAQVQAMAGWFGRKTLRRNRGEHACRWNLSDGCRH